REPEVRALATLRDQRLEIGARGERSLARPGDDRDPHVRGVTHVLPRLGELRVDLGVHRVHDLGTIERDAGDLVADLVDDFHDLPSWEPRPDDTTALADTACAGPHPTPAHYAVAPTPYGGL